MCLCVNVLIIEIMPRKNSTSSVCCVCLNSNKNNTTLNKLSKKDKNDLNLATKLKACIWEIDWRISYVICQHCTDLLNTAYNFREICIKSDLIRKENDTVKTTANCSEEILESNEKNSKTELQTKDNKSNSKKTEKQTCRKKVKAFLYTCEECQNLFTSIAKLVDHCVVEHKMNSKDVRPFMCERCPSRFCNSSNLLQHIKYHNAVRSNICTYCGKGFITKNDLNIHEKQHLNKREYKCDECEKCFNTHKDVRSHKLVVHTDSSEWKYKCTLCNKPFPIKSNYDSHVRRHTGDRKFECHLCQKRFTDKCVLKRHMKTHSNVREFKCKHCNKEYKDYRVMKIHMAKEHGIGLGEIKLPLKERKYICHICSKAYFAKNKLTRHLYTHSCEKPFKCHLCDKKFNDKSYVKQHLLKMHKTDGRNKILLNHQDYDGCADEKNELNRKETGIIQLYHLNTETPNTITHLDQNNIKDGIKLYSNDANNSLICCETPINIMPTIY